MEKRLSGVAEVRSKCEDDRRAVWDFREAARESDGSVLDIHDVARRRSQQSGKSSTQAKCEGDRPEQFGISARRQGESDRSVLDILDCRERRSQQSGKQNAKGISLLLMATKPLLMWLIVATKLCYFTLLLHLREWVSS